MLYIYIIELFSNQNFFIIRKLNQVNLKWLQMCNIIEKVKNKEGGKDEKNCFTLFGFGFGDGL